MSENQALSLDTFGSSGLRVGVKRREFRLFIATLLTMAFDSFRGFISKLEAAGELHRVREPIATELEITELSDREMKKPGGGRALLFERPTVNGAVSPWPLAINTLGSWKRMAMSLDVGSVD